MPKRSLRQQMLALRRALRRDDWLSASGLAQRNLLSLEEYSRAECIALYSPIHNEVDTSLLLEAARAAGKRTLYPVVCGREMVLRQIDHPGQLSQEGAFGILEPCGNGRAHQAHEADLIVVPGVAFDATGHRIGYGKGFYDRFLRHPGQRGALVGLCHDFQLIDGTLPADQHDIRMDIVVTGQRIIRCGGNRRHPTGPDSHRGGS